MWPEAWISAVLKKRLYFTNTQEWNSGIQGWIIKRSIWCQQTSTCICNTASVSLAAAHPCPVRHSCRFGLTMKCEAHKTGEHFLIADSTHGYQKKVSYVPGQLTPKGWKALGSMNKEYTGYGEQCSGLWLRWCCSIVFSTALSSVFREIAFLFYYLKPECIPFHCSFPTL